MASDDMFVVMYRILSYIYQCMRDGMKPAQAEYSADALGIPQGYWVDVMAQLVSHSYIEGITVARVSGGTRIIIENPKVTIEGVQFAKDNSAMARAKKFLMDTNASVPLI